MSEDEMIEEFAQRVRKLAYRACPGNPLGPFVYRGKGYSAFRARSDANFPGALGILVYFGGVPQNIFLKPIGARATIFVEDYEAEEVLQRMREDMVLDDMANV